MHTSQTPANHLLRETSPYLLQHAHNPVDWYPWGDEAFKKAQAQDKPVFLSIGYSTCHWCHVMAHESFEDDEVAALLNRFYIAVKVDREERPDVDAVYMNACQVLTGSGGWPLTIVMTPDQQPFFAGTYLPQRGNGGRMGLMELLETLAGQWQTNREKLLHAGAQITDFLREQAARQPAAAALSFAPLHRAFEQFRQSFDAQNGGFGRAPKFPSPHNLLFLLRYGRAEAQPQALSMVEKTLTQMYRGGLFDHIGGGFSRYSTDARYLVPHFEKMLYDNALLALAYAEAAGATGQDLYAWVARRTLDYVLRELTDADGGFYSAQDADSDGIEGKYYVFTPGEVADVLGEQAGRRFCEEYGITRRGNFEGKSIPNLLENPAYLALPDGAVCAAQEKLYAYRLGRTSLHKDDKILTAWNGLMLAALARAYALLGDSPYLPAARRAASFLSSRLS
ncbi:MAG: thioredoxin domain-containing protein, partial [Eubacteriales bacterium]|nr:thioredoxin domain-containing protein [Eubacteriales bacterium]